MWCVTLPHPLGVGHNGPGPCSGPDLLFSQPREETHRSTGAFKALWAASTNALLPGEHLMIHTPLPMFTIEDSAGTASVLSAAISNELCACILIFVSFLSLSISLLFFSGSFSACIFSHTFDTSDKLHKHILSEITGITGKEAVGDRKVCFKQLLQQA